MAEKGVIGGICHAIHYMGKIIINTLKIMIKKFLSLTPGM